MNKEQLNLRVSQIAKLMLWLVLFNVFYFRVYAQNFPLVTQQKISVSSSAELVAAINGANKYGHIEITLQNGRYQLTTTLHILKPYISLVSVDRNPSTTQIVGIGMHKTTSTDNIIRVAAPYFMLDGITVEQSPNHLIQIAGESNADFPILRNCILKDGYEQLVKVSYNHNTGVASDGGLVENCHFEYSAGIGPQYYIGGIDAHGSQDWVIKNNSFSGIASPENKIAEHAIHFWSGTQNITVTDNTIYNCDRGIGFGMPNRPNFGGIIANNLIVHNDNDHSNADTGIILEESKGTHISGNRIYLAHNYPNAIEYRFAQSSNILIENNRTNKRISKRNGAQAILEDNILTTDINQILSAEEQLQFGFSIK
ncbi:right-handed parallel beta-helix repeat-containing protein [Paraglaciecola sp.]|uniref:right-handed parallel beta-helix repeat-containing protein n=1 Tax=Paraglaciecola sp. TaxID=1920173 RepID=UPI0030F3CC0B